MWVSKFVLFNKCFGHVGGPLRVYIDFTMGFSTWTKNTIGIMIGIALNLWINLYKIVFYFFLILTQRYAFIGFRQEKRGREREKDRLVPPALTLIGDPTHNRDVCPNVGSNSRPLKFGRFTFHLKTYWWTGWYFDQRTTPARPRIVILIFCSNL